VTALQPRFSRFPETTRRFPVRAFSTKRLLTSVAVRVRPETVI
jgi:hypothetical protein